MRVRSEFFVFERHSLKKIFNDIFTGMWLEFLKLFIPAGSVSFGLSVTGPLGSAGFQLSDYVAFTFLSSH